MATPNLNNTTIRGTNARIVFFQDSNKVTLDAKSWTIKPNVTKAADGVNGEQRDRLAKVTNFFEITISCFQRDAEILKRFLEDQANEDAQVAALDKQAGFRLYPRNGTSVPFLLSNVVWDDFEENMSGRADAVMVTLNMRCSDVQLVSSAH